MSEIAYTWQDDGVARTVRFTRVEGTRGTPYRFGADGGEGIREMEVKDFYFATTPVTQSFWAHVMGQPHRCWLLSQLGDPLHGVEALPDGTPVPRRVHRVSRPLGENMRGPHPCRRRDASP